MEEPSTAVHSLRTVITCSGEASSSAVSAVISFVVLAISIGISAFFSARTAPERAWSTIIASAAVSGDAGAANAGTESMVAVIRSSSIVFFINKHHPWIDSGGA